MTDTRVIFGLGNPGAQYRNTRHNCGFRFVEQIASEHQAQLKANPRLQSNLVRVTINGRTCMVGAANDLHESKRSRFSPGHPLLRH